MTTTSCEAVLPSISKDCVLDKLENLIFQQGETFVNSWFKVRPCWENSLTTRATSWCASGWKGPSMIDPEKATGTPLSNCQLSWIHCCKDTNRGCMPSLLSTNPRHANHIYKFKRFFVSQSSRGFQAPNVFSVEWSFGTRAPHQGKILYKLNQELEELISQ